MRFDHRTALITGAGSGIGQATAKILAEHGVDLALLDINADGLAATEAMLAHTGRKVLTVVCDVADHASVDAALGKVREAFPRIDILINNAGIFKDNIMKFHLTDPETWERRWRINVEGTMYITHSLLPAMLEQGYGRIVNLASPAGVYGIVNMVDYSATKGAILSFTKALAKETTPFGVNVTSVSPGMINPVRKPNDGTYRGVSGLPEECAEMIAFLASDNAVHVSGQDYQVDGCRKKM